MLLYTLTGVLLGINWLVYIWAVNTDHILESSLGYFINPLVIVALGVIFLGEKLRPLQWVPVVPSSCTGFYHQWRRQHHGRSGCGSK